MKHYLLSATVLLLAATTFAQEKKEKNDKPPAAALAAFQKAYPGAIKVKWEKEEGDFEVNFVHAKKEMSAVYSATGTLKESEEEIEAAMLPAAASTYIKEHFKGAKIKEAAKITKATGEVTYEAEVNESDVIFDKDGKFVKVEKEKAKEKDKD
jgi:hypothetical protein